MRRTSIIIAGFAIVSLAATARAGDNGQVEYPREWGQDLCLGENGTRVVDTSSTATSTESLIDGYAGEGHQWEPSWSNGLPASFTLRLPRVERWNKLVFTTKTAGEGFPRECELWVGRTQADLHCERTFSLARKNQQIADFETVEGQFLKVVIKSSWHEEEVEVGEIAVFFHAAAPPRAVSGKDTVQLRGGDRLVGQLKGDAFPLKGRFFDLKVPRQDLVGLSLSDEGDRVYLGSGEVLAGDVQTEKFQLEIEAGQVVDLSRSRIASIASGTPAAEFPAKAEDLVAKGHVIVLESGERWIAKLAATRFDIETAIGKVSVSTDAIQAIDFGQNAEPLDRITLRNGDSIRGFVLAGEISAKLALGPEVTIPKGLIERIAFAPEPDSTIDPAASTENQRVALKTGDVLSGSFAAEKFPLRTSYATVDVVLTSLDRLEALDAGRVRVTLRDGATLVGRPGLDALPFDLEAGGRAQVPLDRVKRLDNYRLPPEVQAKLDSLLKKLDDSSWSRRDAAKTELAKLGRAAVPRLTKLSRTGTPEEKKAAAEILGIIKSDSGK